MSEVNGRRGFLGGVLTTCVAPWFVPSSVLARSTQVAPTERINLGLIGCGSMGMANLNGFLRQRGTQVVAVCDPDRERRERAQQRVHGYYAESSPDGTFSGCEPYRDYRELLARDDVDAVIQATPDHWHGPVVIDAAEAGKDCYGEKPLSLTVHEGRRMAEAVRRSSRVFQTGSQQRSDIRFRHACELVRNGRIGTVRRVVCGLPRGSTTGNHPAIPVPDGFDYNLWLGPAPWAPYCAERTHWNFRWILDYSGGQVTDWGAHHIDIAHWGLGLTHTGPVSVEGSGTFPRDGLWNAATEYRFVARYATGVEIEVTSEAPNGVRFEGDEGWVFVTRGRIETSPVELVDENLRSYEKRLYASDDHRRNFLESVWNRTTPICPIEEAHRTVTVAHLGNIAMQLGRRVRWDPVGERILGDDAATRLLDRGARDWERSS